MELIQKGDTTLQNELINSYKPFIAKTVSSVCKRYIYESDDEFSIGLIAFNEAIEKFCPEKGSSLLSFAEVLIKRRVIDYIRKNAKETNLRLDFGEDSANEDSGTAFTLENELSIDHYKKKVEEQRRREEILHFHQQLKGFDLTLQDIIDDAPKHADARQNIILIAKIIKENKELSDYLIEKKRLPIKELEKHVNFSRKTIERNRKYIIAISIIFFGEFDYLRDYIKGVIES